MDVSYRLYAEIYWTKCKLALTYFALSLNFQGH
jgi:hypothetical protein